MKTMTEIVFESLDGSKRKYPWRPNRNGDVTYLLDGKGVKLFRVLFSKIRKQTPAMEPRIRRSAS